MLILARRPDEAIKIGDEVAVILLGIKGTQVRIGKDAPLTVSVHREEAYNRILSGGDTAEEPLDSE